MKKIGKTYLLIAILLVGGLFVLTGCGKKDNTKVLKLTDKYNSLEITLNYPKEAGFTVDEFDEKYSSKYPTITFRNEKENYKVKLRFDELSEITYSHQLDYAKDDKNYSKVEYNEYSGFKHESDSFGRTEMVLKLKKGKTGYIVLVLEFDKIDSSADKTNTSDLFESDEFQEILESITFTDDVKDKIKVDGVMSDNHKLTIKTIKAPSSDYKVSQFEDGIGVMSAYLLNSDKSKYNNSGVYFRLYYYGNEGNYKDLATFQAYKENVYKAQYTDSDLFGNSVKKEVSDSELESKYSNWDVGIIEKDGKVFEFLYYSYAEVDSSIGEQLVKNVLNNIKTND